jgi:hypothetical protein
MQVNMEDMSIAEQTACLAMLQAVGQHLAFSGVPIAQAAKSAAALAPELADLVRRHSRALAVLAVTPEGLAVELGTDDAALKAFAGRHMTAGHPLLGLNPAEMVKTMREASREPLH